MLKLLLGEILGTFILLSAVLIWGKPIPIALALLIALFLFRYVSGTHFNPAISLLMFIKGSINVRTFILYIVAQIIGVFGVYYLWNTNLGIEIKNRLN